MNPALPALFRFREKRGHLRLVEGEEVFDTLAVAGETGGAIQSVEGAVEGGVGGAQGGGHQVGVVEVGQRRAGMGSAGVEDGLGEGGTTRMRRSVRLFRPARSWAPRHSKQRGVLPGRPAGKAS